MYRQVSRSGRGLKSPSRARSPSPAARSTSPTRNLSQLSHSVKQAPIIPRYRPGGDLLQVPAYLASHYNSPIIPNTPVSPMMTPTATGATMTPTSISPKMKPVTPTATGLPTSISPKMKPVSPKVKPVITPVMSTKIPSPKRTPVSPKVTPIPPITATPIVPTLLPYTISHYTDIPVPSPITAPTTVHPPFPLSHYTDIPVPSPITAPTTVHPAYPLPHYTDMPVPSPITAPTTVHTPFPLPHYTDMPVPSPITAPTTVHTPFPLPHYTGYPVPSPITAPIGLPQPPYPLPHFTDIPISSPVNPSGSHIPHPTSTPGMPWWVMAIGMGVATGIAIVIAKERGETIVLPRMSIPSISIPEAALLTMATSEVGMGTESVLKSVSDKVSTTIVPPVKSFLQILFSWVGMCGTFVFFCFVAVIRAKLFASVTGSDSTSSTGSTGTVSFADGPTYIPPLDLATARISLDLSAKTYVEQLIAYYETLALTTDRMSLSQRKLVDDGFQTSKVHVD